jgi:hypothetical protein
MLVSKELYIHVDVQLGDVMLEIHLSTLALLRQHLNLNTLRPERKKTNHAPSPLPTATAAAKQSNLADLSVNPDR